MKKTEKKIPVSKLVNCRQFRKHIPKSDDAFVFPLPYPIRIGTDDNGAELIATHCCLKDLDGNGQVECCFCWINDFNQIVVISMGDSLKELPNSRQIVN